MDCQLVLGSLSNYLDGLLMGQEVRVIPPCNRVRLELVEIRTAARELPLHTPQRALWARVRLSIEAEATRPDPKSLKQPSWWRRQMERRFTFTLPQLAGVGALAMALVAFSLLAAYRQSARPTQDSAFQHGPAAGRAGGEDGD
jgi:hypothetical protein